MTCNSSHPDDTAMLKTAISTHRSPSVVLVATGSASSLKGPGTTKHLGPVGPGTAAVVLTSVVALVSSVWTHREATTASPKTNEVS